MVKHPAGRLLRRSLNRLNKSLPMRISTQKPREGRAELLSIRERLRGKSVREIRSEMRDAMLPLHKKEERLIRYPRIKTEGLLTMEEAKDSILGYAFGLQEKFPFEMRFARRTDKDKANELVQQKLCIKFIANAACELGGGARSSEIEYNCFG
ncbi:Uncharacterised protein [uncultured archaeon]|nr:Uncharacterised protein [uncultured archaeon]